VGPVVAPSVRVGKTSGSWVLLFDGGVIVGSLGMAGLIVCMKSQMLCMRISIFSK